MELDNSRSDSDVSAQFAGASYHNLHNFEEVQVMAKSEWPFLEPALSWW